MLVEANGYAIGFENAQPEEKAIDDTGLTFTRLTDLLSKTHQRFQKLCEKSNVVDITYTRIGVTTGFLSKIYNVVIGFSNGQNVSVIAKIPLVGGIDSICGADGETRDSPPGETLDAHSIECDFYDQFLYMRNVPLPDVYYTEKTNLANGEKGLILMENLATRSGALGFYRSATEEQCYQLAKAVANFQFCAAAPRHKEWWMQLHANIHTDFDMNLVKPLWEFARTIDDLKDFLEIAKPFQNKEFCLYSLREKPEEYNATTMCHGDCQPNNLMFGLKKDGSFSNELVSIIDWQLVFHGSPAFDMARFICLCVDAEVREKAETKFYDLYYKTLSDLYAKSCHKPPFTYQQASLSS
ncbi:unnamed protein product [Bursaphelenchus xylophilus]|uniref:(pine wood nematode) hypothetical protein n=1 Tax=Bursaphelenchus xylophilus TaxID=6326 RepID=A0A811KEQ7_BURXY|nr:unnamed protein product [Bursaphelenchus xylophilus]CAG9093499.1 unnamed protein product [Bursaphelenchus xylophilus]